MSKEYIILMADMISSQKMPQPVSQNEFKHIVEEANHKFEKNILSPLAITLGDEFQGVIKNINTAVSIILYMEEYLTFRNSKIYLRYVVTKGPIDTKINKKIAYGMVGEGLTVARKTLLALKRQKQRFFIFSTQNERDFKTYQLLFVLLEMFFSMWKRKNGILIEYLLSEPDYKKVAAILNKNPSLIWKRKKSLQIDPYIALKKLFEYANPE